jgi:hypothetical protein
MAERERDQIDPRGTPLRSTAPTRDSRWFFVGMAVVLLVIVAVGFAPTFYLPRILMPEQFAAGTLRFPAYLIAHGVVLTLWYLLFLAQSILVATRRGRLHRTVGVGGAVLAAVIVPLSLIVVTRSVARSDLGALPVLGDFGILTLFTVLVALAIHFRRNPDVHKRLMLVASISLVAPAIARWPGAHSALPFSVLLPQLTVFAALIVHDAVTRRRVLPATLFGTAAYIVTMGVSVTLAASPLGKHLVELLR